METYILGVDISKKTFQAAITLDGINFFEQEIENTPNAIRVYFGELKKKFGFPLSKLIVCLEHSGIYSYLLLDFLMKNEVRVCVEPALQIKQSQGMTRGKSDKVDARRIAQYAIKNSLELKFWKPQRPVIQKIKALLTLRDRLVKIKTKIELPINESTEFIEKEIQKVIFKNCQATLKALSKDILKIESEIKNLINTDASLKQQVQLATSVPGVGMITALNVIIASGEFERISEAKKFACYAGVAPFEKSSGTSVKSRPRVSKLANMTLKKLLHLAAVSAIHHCQESREYYQRKLAQGKAPMNMINAVRNKLIKRIYACIKNKRLYQKDFQNAFA
jgi:transposase